MALNYYGDSFLTELDNEINFNEFTIKGMDDLTNIPKDKIKLSVNENNEIQDMYILRQLTKNVDIGLNVAPSIHMEYFQYSTARLLKLENDVYSFIGSMYDENPYLLYTLKMPSVNDIKRLTQIQGNNRPSNPTVNTSGLSQGETGADAINYVVVNNISSNSPATATSSQTYSNRTTTLYIPDTPKGNRGKAHSKSNGNKYTIIDTTTASLINFTSFQQDGTIQDFISFRFWDSVNYFGLPKLFSYNDWKGKTMMKFELDWSLNMENNTNNLDLISGGKYYAIRLLINNNSDDYQIYRRGFQKLENYTYELYKNQLLPSINQYNEFYNWNITMEFEINDTNRAPQDFGYWLYVKKDGVIQPLTKMFDGFITAKVSTY